jgi:hypothetical protein
MSMDYANGQAFEDYLSTLDWASGRTKHLQTYNCFLRAASLQIPPQTAVATVERQIAAAGGVLDPLGVRRQLERAYAYVLNAPHTGAGFYAKSPAPRFSPEKLHEFASCAGIDHPRAFVTDRSAIEPTTVTPESFLSLVNKEGEKIVVFTDMMSQGDLVHTVGAGDSLVPHFGPKGVWFLVQPVDGEFRWNPRANKLSRRSEESVTAWRYLVLESHTADPDDWLRAVALLPLRIVAIYTSGRRSIHCLVSVNAASKVEWDDFKTAIKPAVITLGADPGALTAVRLSRLPQCWRGSQKQELLYLNSNADGTPIRNLAPRKVAPEGGANAS